MNIQISDECAKFSLRGIIGYMSNPLISAQTSSEMDAAQMELQMAYARAARRTRQKMAWQIWWMQVGWPITGVVVAVAVIVGLVWRAAGN